MKANKHFGEISLPIFPHGSQQKFQLLGYLRDIDDTQHCLLDNIWSATNTQNLKISLDALSIYFQNQNFSTTKQFLLSDSPDGVHYNPSTSNALIPACYKNLLARNSKLKDQVTMLQQQIQYFKKRSSITPLVIAEHVQSSPLDDGDSVRQLFSKTLALPKTMSLLPPQLPIDIITNIQHLAQQKSQHFHQFLFQTLTQIAGQNPFHYPEILPGLSFIWDTLYYQHPHRKQCPKTKLHCQQIPLERYSCECNLIYSIPRVCINMTTFQDITIQYENHQILITPSTLLDYGFLKQIIFTQPEQANILPRRLAVCIQNCFSIPSTTICQAIIQSKMPEWTSFGSIIPAQHIIHVTSSPNYNPHYTPSQFHLMGCETPTWICSNPISSQIQDYIAYQIASHIGDNDIYTLQPYQFKLFSEDSIQKIRTINYVGEVPFRFHTCNPTAVQIFEDYIQQESESNYQNPNDNDFWDNLSDDSMANINNAMDP